MPEKTERAERFLTLLKPLQRALENYARRALYDANEVEDALQSVCGNAFRDFEEFTEGTNFRAWMFRYLNLEILSRNRKARSQSDELSEDPSGEQISWEQVVVENAFDNLLASADAILDQCDDVLADAVGCLPENEKAAFLLRAIGEFHYAEIAEILNVPVGTVMSCLSRSRARLRQRLANLAEERGISRTESHTDAPPKDNHGSNS